MPYLDRFALFPLAEQVAGSGFDGLVFGDDLHLQAGYLLLDGIVLPLDDLVEGAPFALDVVDMQPVGGKLKSLPFQYSLAFFVQLEWSVTRKVQNGKLPKGELRMRTV